MKKILALIPVAVLASACGSGHTYSLRSESTTTTSVVRTSEPVAPAPVTAPPTTYSVGSADTLDNTARRFMTSLYDNNSTNTCEFAQPARVQTCETVMSQVTFQATSIRLGHTLLNGNQGLVVQLGTMCEAKACVTNINPDAGLPKPGVSFQQAVAATQTGSPDPAHAFVFIDGRWWAEF